MLAVVVMDDAAAQLLESATFCKLNDDHRPSLVGLPDFSSHQICPDDLTMSATEVADAYPPGWYARIMFDRLLDPNIEDLIPVLDSNNQPTGQYTGTLANTQPVTLKCQSSAGGTLGGMVTIPYDGYYSPSGNNVTWPLGPSLVIKPLDPTLIATGAECQVVIKDVVKDKGGNQVPTAERGNEGEYKFKIAPVSIVPSLVSPSDGSAVDGIAAGVDVTFNTSIVKADLVAPVDTTPHGGAWDTTPHVLTQGLVDETSNGAPEYFFYGDYGSGGTYEWTFNQGTKIHDQCGVATTFPAPDVALGTDVHFTTNAFKLTGIAPFDGQMGAPPYKHIQLAFNNYPDATTLTAGSFTVNEGSSTGPALTVTPTMTAGGAIELVGAYKGGTIYVFKVNAGTMIKDCPGGEAVCVTTGTYPISTGDAAPITFKTADVALTSTSPADNDTVTTAIDMVTGKGPVAIDLTFNQDMDATTFTGTTTTPVVTLAAAAGSTDNIVELTGQFAPGTYTLNVGGTVKDTGGATFTIPTQVVHFTVMAASAAPTPTPCF